MLVMQNCCDKSEFPDHSKELGKLNRISGQVEGIKRMINERRYCPDIIIQLKAISSAVKAVEANILKSHLESCVKQVFQENDQAEQAKKIAELLKLFKKS